MRLKKKLKNQSGFSLAETLLAVLILLLVSAIVANGIPVARNVYNNVIVGANAQVLLSTAVTALRNELGTAQRVEAAVDRNSITYYNPTIQAYSRISKVGSPESIKVDPYLDPADLTRSIPGSVQRELVTNAASNKDLFVTFGSVERVSDIVVFKDIEVKRITGDKATITSLNELKIRLIPVVPDA